MLHYQSADYNNFDAAFWSTLGTANGGSTSQGSGLMTLTTGASANGGAMITSRRASRFLNGTVSIWTATVQLPSGGAPSADNISRWGMVGGNNSVCRFEMNAGSLDIVYGGAGSFTSVPQASWTNGGAFTMNGNFHTYEIAASAGGFEFSIDGTVVHSLPMTGSALTHAMDWMLLFQTNNVNGSTTVTPLNVRGVAICRIGPNEPCEPTWARFNATGTTSLKAGAGRLKRLVINTAGSSSATATLWDSPTGTGAIMATVNLSTARTLEYDFVFKNGLTIVIAGTSAGDLTLVYE